MREELGSKVRYRLGKPVALYRGYFESRKIYIFAVMYEAEWISGAIKLSFEHDRCEWINPKTHRFRKKDFSSDEQYNAIQKYFKSL